MRGYFWPLNVGACSPSLWARIWQGMFVPEMHKSGAITCFPQLLTTAGHSSVLCSAAAGEMMCWFVGEESVLSCTHPPLTPLAYHWLWGAPHPWGQGEVTPLGALFFSCGCTVVWRVPARRACSLLLAGEKSKIILVWGLFFAFLSFGLPCQPGKFMLLWRKHSTHLQATTAAMWVIKYGKEEGRGKKEDGSWCFIWKASGQKWLCFRHVDSGEAAFAA